MGKFETTVIRGKMILEKSKINENFEPDLSEIDATGLIDMDLYVELYGRYDNENDFKISHRNL